MHARLRDLPAVGCDGAFGPIARTCSRRFQAALHLAGKSAAKIFGHRRFAAPTAVTLGLAGAAASLALRFALSGELGDGEPLVAIFPAVLIVTLVAGAWAGWVSLVGGLVGAWYLFMGAPFTFTLAPHEVGGLLAAFAMGTVVITVSALLRGTLDALETANIRESLMARELQHRIKNVLMLVMSISRRTYRPGISLSAAQKSFEARLMALAEAHNSIGVVAASGVQVHDLVVIGLRPFGYNPNDQQFDIGGPALLLGPRAAVALAMALHELATNAAKYGALTQTSGHVSVTWSYRRDPIQTFQFDWRESGGPPVEKPAKRGFGSQLIERNLAHALGGTANLIFATDGLRAEILAVSGFQIPGDVSRAPQRTSDTNEQQETLFQAPIAPQV